MKEVKIDFKTVLDLTYCTSDGKRLCKPFWEPPIYILWTAKSVIDSELSKQR